jgi:hypothetical protein
MEGMEGRATDEDDRTMWRQEGTGKVMEETRHYPIDPLAGFGQRQVQFRWRLLCRLL